MSASGLIQWSEASWLGQIARDVFWVFPAAEIVHFIGLCLLIGAMLVIDLRLLGLGRRIVSIDDSLSLIPVAIAGLFLNLGSGVLFLCAHPDNYWPSTAFRLKLLAIALAAGNALWFKFAEAPRVAGASVEFEADRRTKTVAVLSLFVWTAVIVLGRFLPFVSKSTS
jgi:hypothetical protein